MKKYKKLLISFSVVALFLTACTTEDNPSSPDENNIQPPAAPSLLSGYAISDTSIYLSWLDNSTDETHFVIYRNSADSFAALDSVPATRRYYTDNGLDESTSYSYFVTAINSGGDSPSTDTLTLTTFSSNTPPVQPSDPSPADSAVNQPLIVELSWSCYDPDEDDTLSYNLYLGTVSDTVLQLIAADIAQSSYTTDELMPDAAYNWQVVAYDNHSDSTSGPIWIFSTELPP